MFQMFNVTLIIEDLARRKIQMKSLDRTGLSLQFLVELLPSYTTYFWTQTAEKVLVISNPGADLSQNNTKREIVGGNAVNNLRMYR